MTSYFMNLQLSLGVSSKIFYFCITEMHVETALEESLVAVFGSDIQVHAHNLVFETPGAGFGVIISGGTYMRCRLDGGFNYFTISVCDTKSKEPRGYHIHPPPGMDWVPICDGLDSTRSYLITVTKNTEAVLRYPLSNFEAVKVRGFKTDGMFHSISAASTFHPRGWVEIIGDSDACGFGIDGHPSSASNFLTMDPAAQDVHGAWGCVLADLLGLGKHASRIVAYSGKGISQNAPFCGDETIPEIWAKLEGTKHKMGPHEAPSFVAILLGGNDFYDHEGPPLEVFISKVREFLNSIRNARGETVPIFVFQCSPSCLSSAGSPSVHPSEDREAVAACERLTQWTQFAVESAGGRERFIFFSTVEASLKVPDDYGIMMHWNRSGQRKIAKAMLRAIVEHKRVMNAVWPWCPEK